MMSNKPNASTFRALNLGWIIKMAIRDSRRDKSRLFLFIASIVLGIAAVVAISSFGDNLKKDVDGQAAALLGADLVIDSRKALSENAQYLVDSLKEISNASAEERSFASMVVFGKNGESRLVQIRAIQGNFPFYGELTTIPESAEHSFREGKRALVDKTLMLQFNAGIGDEIGIGYEKFIIAGTLEKAPGQTGLASAMAPAVFIPLSYLESTGLLQKGSRINTIFYYQLPTEVETDKLLEKLDKRFEQEGLDVETIEMRKESTGRSFEDLTGFLSLVGFIALLLGCIGVSSAIQIYIREKLNSIAILRCLGVSAQQAFLIFLVQVAGIGLLGSLVGAALGLLIQQFLPIILQELLPLTVSNAISWMAIGKGVLLGVFISVLFAWLPLAGLRRVSPLSSLRVSFEEKRDRQGRLEIMIGACIVLFILVFARTQVGGWKQAMVFTGSVVIGYLILYGMSHVLVMGIKRYFPYSWSYLWRQGLSNLYRPNNQTVIMVMAIGLGTAFIATLFFVKTLLIGKVSFSTSEHQPNMVLFNIQTAQKEKVASFVRAEKLPIIQEVPIVTVQLDAVNGYTAAAVRQDSTLGISNRAFGSELRVTFRDSLIASEKITDGEWVGHVEKGDTAMISFGKEYAERIGVKVGDHLRYNVQGVMVPTVIGSLRKIDWNRVQTNFRVVFPRGVIDDAPQFHVIMTRVQNEQESADFQGKLVQEFPNISIIDLKLILTVLDELLDKIAFVVQFMAALSILTGMVVLIASVMMSKYPRIRESILLRTLGASRKQVLAISALEYFFLGSLASLTGIFIALLASWAMAVFMFDASFSPSIIMMVMLWIGITGLTVLIGVLNSLSLLNKPPMEVLGKAG